MQGKTDGSSVSNIFENSCTEEGMGAGNYIFERGFKFAASEERKNFDITASSVQRE